MAYEKKPSYEKRSGKGKGTLNRESLTVNRESLTVNREPRTVNQGRPES